MSEVFEPVVLKNGLMIRFEDLTNRYFGDFHRICIKVLIELPASVELPASISRESVRLEQTLEKMAVPSAALVDETHGLIDSFLSSSKSYLEKDEFISQLIARAKEQKRTSATLLFSR